MSIDFLVKSRFHRCATYLSDISIGPEVLLPFRIIEWLSQDQADKFLSFNNAQNIYQRA